MSAANQGRLLLVFILVLVAAFGLVNCGGSAGGIVGSSSCPGAPSSPPPSSPPPPLPLPPSLTVAPSPAIVPAGVIGDFIAFDTLSNGQVQKSFAVTWTSSNPSVAAIATIGGDGEVTTMTPGTTVIQASEGSLSASAQLTVTPDPSSIQIFPANVSAHVSTVVQFTAFGTLPDGSVLNVTAMANWSTSNPQVVPPIGIGYAQAAAVGTSTIQATIGAVSGTATMNVVPVPTTASVTLLPQNQQLELGSTTGLPLVLALASDGTSVPAPQLAFSSSDPNVVAIKFVHNVFPYLSAVGIGTATISGQGTVNGVPITLSTNVTVIPPQALFAYVADAGANKVLVYQVGNNGQLQLTNTVAAGSQPSALAVDFIHRLVLVANTGSGNISVFAIQPCGALAPVPGSPFAAGRAPDSLAVDGLGRFLYVSNGDQQLLVFSIDPQTGALQPFSTPSFLIGVGPHNLTLQADGSGYIIYVANGGSNNISAYSVSFNTGALSPVPLSPLPTSAGPAGFWSDGGIGGLDGQGFSTVINSGSNDIWLYNQDVASGTWSPEPTAAAVAAGLGPSAIAAAPVPFTTNYAIRILYVTNRGSNNVSAYFETSTFFEMTLGILLPLPGSPFASAGTGPVAIAADPIGSFVYVVNSGSNAATPPGAGGSIGVFQIDPTSGGLIQMGSVSGVTAPEAIALSKKP